MLLLFGYYNDEIIITTKNAVFIYMKSFLNYFVLKMILLNIFQNVGII